MDRYTRLYNQLIALEKEKYTGGGHLPRLKRYRYTWLLLAREKIARKLNPIVKVMMNHQEVRVPLAHNLPLYMARYRSYDKPIMIISNWIYEQKHALNFVDVGANVGDTVVNVGIKNGNYLEIEGDKRYFECLDKNLKNYHYELADCFLSDSLDDKQQVNVSYALGHVLKKTDSNVETLSSILNKKGFAADIIKIDTDGYDMKVIRGGMEYLQANHPYLFTEWYPKWLTENNRENPLMLFKMMNEAGYRRCILFDNYGTINAVLDTDDMLNFRILEKYSLNEEKQIYYWDVLFVPPQAGDIDSLIEKLIKWEDYC